MKHLWARVAAGDDDALFEMFSPGGNNCETSAIVECIESEGADVVERCLAIACVAQLATRAVTNKRLDALCASLCRKFFSCIRKALTEMGDVDEAIINGSQFVCGRCGSYSRSANQKSFDEVKMMVEAGLFDALAQSLNPSKKPSTKVGVAVIHAFRGMCLSRDAIEAQGQRDPDVVLQVMKQLRAMPSPNFLSSDGTKVVHMLVDGLELVAFKKHVKDRVNQAGDGGAQMANDMLGVVGTASGPQGLGFKFTNDTITKDFKTHAFEQGVIKPMQQKMAEDQDQVGIDGLAQQVLRQHMEGTTTTVPVKQCGNPDCPTPDNPTKRCSACKQQMYCSVECQKVHYKVHKGECKKSEK